MTGKLWIPVVLTGFAISTSARALDNYDPNNISQLTNAAAEAMIKTVAVGGAHKAYLSARPLGHVIGLDLGITVEGITLPQEFKDGLALVSGTAAASLPSLVPLPKFSLTKGLPGGIDLGVSFIQYTDVFKSFGAAARFGFESPIGLWFGGQISGNYTKIYFLSTHTYGLDVVASKSFALIEPYLGLGVQVWSGDVAWSANAGNVPVGVSAHQSGTSPHVYFGLPLSLLALKITGQIDYSFAGIMTYGAKFALSF